METLYLLTLALGPAFILVHLLWSHDRFREPYGNLSLYLLLGAASVVPTVLVEMIVVPIWPELFGSLLGAVLTAFLGVALVEEGFKLLFLRWRARRDAHLDEPFDWVVYAVSVSLGFAAVENVLYVMEHGAATGWLRALTAVPCHALFGTVMGAYLAKTFHARGSTPAGWFALFMPTLWHGAYDAPLFLMEVGAPAGVCITIWLLVVALLWRTAVRQLRQLRVVQDFPAPPLLDPLHTPQVLMRRGRANTNS